MTRDPTLADPPAAAAPDQFPCPQCGAELRYDAATLSLVCEHCGHQRPVSPSGPTPTERDYLQALAQGAATHDAAQARDAKCDSCGATVSLETGLDADVCPFCAGALALDPDPRRRFAPDGLLPFAVPEDAARKALSEWLDGLWFAPGDLGAYARKDRRLTGVYLPFWTFDADASAEYQGQRGDAYTTYERRTRFVDGKAVTENTPVRKIRWTPVSGRVRKLFDDVLVAAGRSLPDSFAAKLSGLRGGWDLHGLLPHQPEYLAGLRAESYAVDLETGFAEARAAMELTLRRLARFDIGGDEQRVARLDTSYRDVSFKLVLLPIWIAAYRYRDQTYRFVVNGRTGEVIGERPYSWWKIALAALGGALLLALLGWAALAFDGRL